MVTEQFRPVNNLIPFESEVINEDNENMHIADLDPNANGEIQTKTHTHTHQHAISS